MVENNAQKNSPETNINQIIFEDNKPWYAPHYPFSLEGHWQPWYDDRRDYNTNAPTYYDYLSNFNHLIKSITELLNRVARRNIEVEDTNCIDLTKINDWIDEGNDCHTYHDIITLKAKVILSTYQKALNFDGKNYNLTNAISCLNSGLYASDYLPLIEALADKLNQTIADNNDKFKDLQDQINQINQEINNIKKIIKCIQCDITNIKNIIKDMQGDISNIKNDITNINNRIDDLTTFAAATIQPPLKVIEFNKTDKIQDNGTNPPNKRKGIDYSNIRVEYEQGKFRTYEYFKVGLVGYNLKNAVVGDVICELPISEAKAKGISNSLIEQAYYYTWTISSGYTTNNSFNQIAFGISATTNYTDYSGKLQIKVLKFEGGSPISGFVNEDNTNHVIVNVFNS